MERLRIYLTNEFKYRTLTCPLVIGGNKGLFSHSAKWTCTSGEGGGGGGAILSIVDSIKTLTFYLKVWCKTSLASAGLLFSQIW